MPTPPSKPTDPKVVAAAKETARQQLMRFLIDATSWTDQGVGPTHSPQSRREHAGAFIRNALEPGAGAKIRKIAQTVALPIVMQEKVSRSKRDARRNDILVTAVELVCKTHNLHPTRSAAGAESGCSIVAMALADFLDDWRPTFCGEKVRVLHALAKAHPDPETVSRVHVLCEHLAVLPARVRKLFPKGALVEEGIKAVWEQRARN